MKVRATDEQIATMAANAVSAAQPAGMGILHFKPGSVGPERFAAAVASGSVSLDYVDGRMTKLHLSRDTDGEWKIPDHNPNPEYQSWCRKYPTYRALAESAGIAIP